MVDILVWKKYDLFIQKMLLVNTDCIEQLIEQCYTRRRIVNKVLALIAYT